MSGSLSPGNYVISSFPQDLSLHVNGTSVLGEYGSLAPSAWSFQQFDDQGGKWSIKDMNSGLYLSGSVDDDAIQAVESAFLWDIWYSPSPNFSDGSSHYRIFVDKTTLSVTLNPTDFTVFLSDASGGDIYQNWFLKPIVI